MSEEATAHESDGAGPAEAASEREELKAALAAQVQMLWELDLGDVPMALRFEPRSRRE